MIQVLSGVITTQPGQGGSHGRKRAVSFEDPKTIHTGCVEIHIRIKGACGARVVGAAVVIEIDMLRGRVRWPDAIPLRTLLRC